MAYNTAPNGADGIDQGVNSTLILNNSLTVAGLIDGFVIVTSDAASGPDQFTLRGDGITGTTENSIFSDSFESQK